jgi:hypothetical protein
MNSVLKIKICIVGGALLFVPAFSFAAVISIDPIQKEVHYGDTFIMNIRLDNQGECVNAAQVTVRYDNKVLDAVDFSRGESILTLWVDVPKIDHTAGTITFSGGIPGGYCGRVVGDPGLSNLLGKIVFNTTGNQITASPGAVAQIHIAEDSEVLLNDGLGTKAILTVKSAQVTVLQQQSLIKNEWVDQIRQDTISPESFEVLVHQDQNIAGGKYFVTFSTLDKQSGIDHFEVFESSLNDPGYEVGGTRSAEWRVVEKNEQYYVLRDQTLKSKVIVKAIDKAGNEQLSELGDNAGVGGAPVSANVLEKALMGILIIGGAGIVIGTVMFFFRKRQKITDDIHAS